MALVVVMLTRLAMVMVLVMPTRLVMVLGLGLVLSTAKARCAELSEAAATLRRILKRTGLSMSEERKIL